MNCVDVGQGLHAAVGYDGNGNAVLHQGDGLQVWRFFALLHGPPVHRDEVDSCSLDRLDEIHGLPGIQIDDQPT